MLAFLRAIIELSLGNAATAADLIDSHYRMPNGNSLFGYPPGELKGWKGPAVTGVVTVGDFTVQLIKRPGPNVEVVGPAVAFDCSNWVWAAQTLAGNKVSYVNAHETGDAIDNGTLRPGDQVGGGSYTLLAADEIPQPGDVVVFDTHMGIVAAPPDANGHNGFYFGSQGDSGLARKHFGLNYPHGFSHQIGYLRPNPGVHVGLEGLLADPHRAGFLRSLSAELGKVVRTYEVNDGLPYGWMLAGAGNDKIDGSKGVDTAIFVSSKAASVNLRLLRPGARAMAATLSP